MNYICIKSNNKSQRIPETNNNSTTAAPKFTEIKYQLLFLLHTQLPRDTKVYFFENVVWQNKNIIQDGVGNFAETENRIW